MKKLILFLLVMILFAFDGVAGVRVAVGVRIGAPPPARREVIVARPHKHSVWVPGYWAFDGRIGEYIWIPGSWQRPPHRHAVWVAPIYHRGRHGHSYVVGYWR